MDEDRVIGRMIETLLERPNKWLTFAYLSALMAIQDCDENVVGAMADFRPDLFAVSRDRKLKLRSGVAEEIARQGIRWHVPERPEALSPGNFRQGSVSVPGIALGGACYCSVSYERVLDDLKAGSVPDEALLFSCCWKNICRVRGIFLKQIPDQTWTEICRRRGYIQQRENPRGF
jgi:hypothetical protein